MVLKRTAEESPSSWPGLLRFWFWQHTNCFLEALADSLKRMLQWVEALLCAMGSICPLNSSCNAIAALLLLLGLQCKICRLVLCVFVCFFFLLTFASFEWLRSLSMYVVLQQLLGFACEI